eukprot:TRINITY_DN17990_c0_g1_i4.p1 TRINITY_DN17990_c0_g1~~TRINITY_DN17990_c0_g1_i4.p1  ORF type:complete len:1945 (+),score=412.20 TRINITY_DN17990_c0_g1_i4:99-5837(+)
MAAAAPAQQESVDPRTVPEVVDSWTGVDPVSWYGEHFHADSVDDMVLGIGEWVDARAERVFPPGTAARLELDARFILQHHSGEQPKDVIFPICCYTTTVSNLEVCALWYPRARKWSLLQGFACSMLPLQRTAVAAVEASQRGGSPPECWAPRPAGGEDPDSSVVPTMLGDALACALAAAVASDEDWDSKPTAADLRGYTFHRREYRCGVTLLTAQAEGEQAPLIIAHYAKPQRQYLDSVFDHPFEGAVLWLPAAGHLLDEDSPFTLSDDVAASLPWPGVLEYLRSRPAMESIPTKAGTGCEWTSNFLWADGSTPKSLISQCYTKKNQQEHDPQLYDKFQTITAHANLRGVTPQAAGQVSAELIRHLFEILLHTTRRPSASMLVHALSLQLVSWHGRLFVLGINGCSKGSRAIGAAGEHDTGRSIGRLHTIQWYYEHQPYQLLNSAMRAFQVDRRDAILRVSNVGGTAGLSGQYKCSMPADCGGPEVAPNFTPPESVSLDAAEWNVRWNRRQQQWQAELVRGCQGTRVGGWRSEISFGHATTEDSQRWRFLRSDQVEIEMHAWMLPQLRQMCWWFEHSLRCLPTTRVQKVYRGLAGVQLNRHLYAEGRLVLWGAFSSSSRDQGVAQQFAEMSKRHGAVAVVFIIDCNTPRKIAPWSRLARENERIFAPNSVFVVTSAPGLSEQQQELLGVVESLQLFEIQEPRDPVQIVELSLRCHLVSISGGDAETTIQIFKVVEALKCPAGGGAGSVRKRVEAALHALLDPGGALLTQQVALSVFRRLQRLGNEQGLGEELRRSCDRIPSELLIQAATDGQDRHRAIQPLVERFGARLNHTDERGMTAMHHAARMGHLRFAEGLFRVAGYTPPGDRMMSSTWRTDDEPLPQAVKDLLECRDEDKNIPLHLAACMGHNELARTLSMTHPDSRSIPDRQGRVPRYIALENGWDDTAEKICGHRLAWESLVTPLRSASLADMSVRGGTRMTTRWCLHCGAIFLIVLTLAATFMTISIGIISNMESARAEWAPRDYDLAEGSRAIAQTMRLVKRKLSSSEQFVHIAAELVESLYGGRPDIHQRIDPWRDQFQKLLYNFFEEDESLSWVFYGVEATKNFYGYKRDYGIDKYGERDTARRIFCTIRSHNTSYAGVTTFGGQDTWPTGVSGDTTSTTRSGDNYKCRYDPSAIHGAIGIEPYNLSQREWYWKYAESNDLRWVPVYVFAGGDYGSSVVWQRNDANGSKLAVFGSDLSFRTLNQDLNKVWPAKHGMLAVFDAADGQLVGTSVEGASEDSGAGIISPAGTYAHRVHVQDYLREEVHDAGSLLERMYGSFTEVPNITAKELNEEDLRIADHFEFRLGYKEGTTGGTYHAVMARRLERRGFNWVIMVTLSPSVGQVWWWNVLMLISTMLAFGIPAVWFYRWKSHKKRRDARRVKLSAELREGPGGKEPPPGMTARLRSVVRWGPPSETVTPSRSPATASPVRSPAAASPASSSPLASPGRRKAERPRGASGPWQDAAAAHPPPRPSPQQQQQQKVGFDEAATFGDFAVERVESWQSSLQEQRTPRARAAAALPAPSSGSQPCSTFAAAGGPAPDLQLPRLELQCAPDATAAPSPSFRRLIAPAPSPASPAAPAVAPAAAPAAAPDAATAAAQPATAAATTPAAEEPRPLLHASFQQQQQQQGSALLRALHMSEPLSPPQHSPARGDSRCLHVVCGGRALGLELDGLTVARVACGSAAAAAGVNPGMIVCGVRGPAGWRRFERGGSEVSEAIADAGGDFDLLVSVPLLAAPLPAAAVSPPPRSFSARGDWAKRPLEPPPEPDANAGGIVVADTIRLAPPPCGSCASSRRGPSSRPAPAAPAPRPERLLWRRAPQAPRSASPTPLSVSPSSRLTSGPYHLAPGSAHSSQLAWPCPSPPADCASAER